MPNVCYFRTWTEPDRLRSVSRTTSPDFIAWSEPVAMEPNLPGEHLYTTFTHPYFRAPHIYIALPTRYVPGRGDAPSSDAKDRNATDVLFMSTRAGTTKYERQFTEAFIRPGLDAKQWGNRANYVAQNVQPTGPEEMSIYHRSGERYELRTDGFISMHAGQDAGELTTRPLIYSGQTLSVNASTSAAGSLRVEIQDAAGRPLPGFTSDDGVEFYGDQIDADLKWRNNADLSTLAGQAVRLRFMLRECDLYSFRFH